VRTNYGFLNIASTFYRHRIYTTKTTLELNNKIFCWTIKNRRRRRLQKCKNRILSHTHMRRLLIICIIIIT